MLQDTTTNRAESGHGADVIPAKAQALIRTSEPVHGGTGHPRGGVVPHNTGGSLTPAGPPPLGAFSCSHPAAPSLTSPLREEGPDAI